MEKESVKKYAEEFGWTLITKDNIKEKFMEMAETMTMSYSYKPVFLNAFLDCMDETGSARLEEVADRFAKFYEDRISRGLPAEKKNCIFTKGGYTRHDVEQLILRMPFNRFEQMNVMHHAKQLGTIQFYKVLYKQLTEDDFTKIQEYCDAGIKKYFGQD